MPRHEIQTLSRCETVDGLDLRIVPASILENSFNLVPRFLADRREPLFAKVADDEVIQTRLGKQY